MADDTHLSSHRLFHLLLFLSILHLVNTSDYDTLLELKNSFTNGNNKLITWNPLTTPCTGNKTNWDGVICMNDTVSGIRLEGMELRGIINAKILMKLPSLLTISFQNNSFNGQFPEFKRIPGLRSIFLTANRFSGGIPADAFDGMRRLKKVYLANNEFDGKIPLSLTILPKLRDLMLENNQFEGEIPAFVKEKLTNVNFANNHLHGPIPERFHKFPANRFTGNNELCGAPLGRQCKAETKPETRPDNKPETKPENKPDTSTSTLIILALVVVAALSAMTAALVILHRFGPSSKNVHASACTKGPSSDHDEMEQGCGKATATADIEASLKLTFLKDNREKFDLAELMKASAQILGSGAFGSSYRTALTRHKVLVVKRFRQMNNVTKDEFVKHMTRLGKVNHPNVLPVIAFYYRNEEKLFVVDYIKNLGLAVHLHGKRSSVSRSLDWPTRLKIVKGIARGLIHLYNELPSLIAPHGHLKSSNVLLNQEFEPLLTDYGLVPITNQEHAQEVMIAFKSPEYKQDGRITKKTDVWSLGVLILEIMTGKFPANCFNQGKGGDDTELADFVDAMMKEELTSDVFDKEMGEFDKCNKEEMVKLLNIGLSCCEPDVDKRWDIKEVVNSIEEVKEKNDEDEDEDNDDDNKKKKDDHQ